MPARHPLSAVPPDEFTAARNALVRQLRERGEAGEARRVGALRKPSTPLWIVNQLGGRAPGLVEELIDATRRARGAQVHPRGRDELHDAMQAQRQALHELLAEAEKAAAGIGTRITPEIQRRILDTLQTAAASEPKALAEGALEQELSAAGFGALLGAGGAQAAAKAAVEKAAVQKSAVRQRAQAQKEKLEERRKALLRDREAQHAEQAARRLDNRARQLERMADRAAQAAQRAQEKAREARAAADGAAARLLQLRRE